MKLEIEKSSAAPPALSPADMLRAVIQGGVTAENVATVEKILELAERQEKRQAEKEFAEAFLELQAALPVIQGMKEGMHKGIVYATFEDIDAIVRPICLRHGFTYAFREDSFQDGRVTVTMDLTHRGGHTRSIPYTVRAGRGPTGCNESQADMAGHTYAQRGAMEAGLCLRILNKRVDAKMEGGRIHSDRAFEIERRAKETNSDIAKLFKLAGVTRFEDITEAKAEVIENFLAMKERGGR
jgi:hypothetical protein